MTSSLGRPAAVEREAGAASPLALAFDIGGTKIAAGLVDAEGGVRSFGVEPTRAVEGPQAGVERLFELGRRVVAEAGEPWSSVAATGIACGGPLDAAAGVLSAPPHLPGWVDVPLAALAERAFERPAVLENDATAAAAGEHRHGAGRGVRNMLYLTISTGVGGGIVVDDRLYRGSTGNGGELGHVTIDVDGRDCRGCGRRGCLEAYVSGTSIAERAREALAASDGSSSLAAVVEPTSRDVAAAAAAGDALAASVWGETVEALSCGLCSLVNVFEPELVVIGGGVARTGEQLLAPVRERVPRDAMGPAASARIVASSLGERVGVIGAATVAFERVAAGSRGGA
ncbi:MAG TPA: ROK family protein [Solirubrobacter sp.]|nr:ROK family protein [Solirubrobacter sp.]